MLTRTNWLDTSCPKKHASLGLELRNGAKWCKSMGDLLRIFYDFQEGNANAKQCLDRWGNLCKCLGTADTARMILYLPSFLHVEREVARASVALDNGRGDEVWDNWSPDSLTKRLRIVPEKLHDTMRRLVIRLIEHIVRTHADMKSLSVTLTDFFRAWAPPGADASKPRRLLARTTSRRDDPGLQQIAGARSGEPTRKRRKVEDILDASTNQQIKQLVALLNFNDCACLIVGRTLNHSTVSQKQACTNNTVTVSCRTKANGSLQGSWPASTQATPRWTSFSRTFSHMRSSVHW